MWRTFRLFAPGPGEDSGSLPRRARAGARQASGARSSARYRPEVDGLRAIAVLAVMYFHGGFPLSDGGYAGVDVFFVISGYLISTVIMEDLEAGRFSLATFYTRRVRRIIPALALVVLLCVPLAWAMMTADQLREFSSALFGVATFSSNVVFWLGNGAVPPKLHLDPLIHTWSLAVEEQFYLLFPLLMLALWKLKGRWIAATFLSLALASAVAAEAVARISADAAFYLTPFRGWELLAGAWAARIHLRSPDRDWNNDLLAMLGLALVLASFGLLRAHSLVPGIVAIPIVAGTALLLLFGREGTWVGKRLATPALVQTGLISYSLYLWHLPLLAFAWLAKGEPLSVIERVTLLAATFPIAYASWALVETPFRDRRRVSTRVAWLGAAIFTIAATAVGLAGYLRPDGWL